ncbi:MAG: DUF2945 domain-containing protein [Bdellovibrionales bacterium]
MASKMKVGSAVQWKWYGGSIHGKIVEIFPKPVVKEIKGKKIKRNGSKENPACLVKSDAGNLALKLMSELTVPDSAAAKLRDHPEW